MPIWPSTSNCELYGTVNTPLLSRVTPLGRGWLGASPPNPPAPPAPFCVDVNCGAKLLANSGEIGDLGRSRRDCGESDDPDAGDENIVLARLATVGAGDDAQGSSMTGKPTGDIDRPLARRLSYAAGVAASDIALREGGLGRGLVLLEDARRSVNVGCPF